MMGVPFCDLRTVRPMSLTSLQETDFANVHLLLPFLNEAAAGVHVVVRQRLLHLADAEVVSGELVRVNLNLILASDSAETRHINDIGNRFKLLFDHPVLKRLQLHQVIPGIGAFERVPVELTDRAVIRPDIRLQVVGQVQARRCAPELSAGSSRSLKHRRRSS